MKPLFAFLLCVITLPCFSQKVWIKGFASNKTNGAIPVSIVVNDTLSKAFREYYLSEKIPNEKRDKYFALTKDTSVAVYSADDKSFKIKALLTDTLYFKCGRFITQKYLVSDLLRSDKIEIKLSPEPCIEYIACKDTVPSNYYVFIGERISVKGVNHPKYCNVFPRDGKFEAVYKIIKNINGEFKQDTIRFIAYDHYYTAKFSKSKYALLFVGEYCGELIHSKYQYFDVYPTKDGRWASPGNPYRFDDNFKSRSIKAVQVAFDNDLSFDTNSLFFRNSYTETTPYFTIEGTKATPVMGTYIDDLVKLKQEADLKYLNIVLK